MTKRRVIVVFIMLSVFTITAAYTSENTGMAVAGGIGDDLIPGQTGLTKQITGPSPKKADGKALTLKKSKNSKIDTSNLAYGDVLDPDKLYDVPLSKTEINRISTDETIKTIKYDQDIPDLAIDYEGSDAFIIYKGKKPFLAYVVTENNVYHTRFTPTGIPATYYILSEKALSQKNSTQFASSKPALKGNSMEARLTEMVKHAYSNEPQGAGDIQVDPLDDIIKTKELEFFSYKTYKFKEDNIFVKVLLVRTKKGYFKDTVAIREKDFILPEILQYPVAIAIENHLVNKDEFTRIFLVGADYQMRASL